MSAHLFVPLDPQAPCEVATPGLATAYVFSADQTETLYRLTGRLIRAAARPDPEPVDGTYTILFNPKRGRFGRIYSRPDHPEPLQTLLDAGFVSLFGIPHYRGASESGQLSKADFRQAMLALELETRHRPQALRFSAWAWLTQGDRTPRRALELLFGR